MIECHAEDIIVYLYHSQIEIVDFSIYPKIIYPNDFNYINALDSLKFKLDGKEVYGGNIIGVDVGSIKDETVYIGFTLFLDIDFYFDQYDEFHLELDREELKEIENIVINDFNNLIKDSEISLDFGEPGFLVKEVLEKEELFIQLAYKQADEYLADEYAAAREDGLLRL